MRRGEIWTVAGGVYASKPRPAVVVQADIFDSTGSVTVCPFTSTLVDAPLLRMVVEPDEASGLTSTSFVMVDKLTTVRRSNVNERLGCLTMRQILELERRLMVFLGLAA